MRAVAKKRTVTSRTKPTKKKTSSKVNVFHQRLARLTVYQATQMLGEEGAHLLQKGGQIDIDPFRDVHLGADLYQVKVSALTPLAQVTIAQQNMRDKQLLIQCDQCSSSCIHMGVALSYLLEAKAAMGLSAPPDESVPLENLTDSELHRRAVAEREQRAREEKMTVRSTDATYPWSDYIVTSQLSGKTYRVALRGTEPGQSYCSCPDFRTNELGTCKHILHALDKVKRKFTASRIRKPYVRTSLSVRVSYQQPKGLLINVPTQVDAKLAEIVGDSDRVSTDGLTMMNTIQAIEQAGYSVHIYPDAEELIQRALVQKHLTDISREIRRAPNKHPLRSDLLSVPLLPYQLDGIGFAVGAGRSILADDMGLGKTIQGIGVAELLAREADIQRVLVVCPASLKSQWVSEIGKFANRSAQLVIGSASERAEQYRNGVFFTICNYEQIQRDLQVIETVRWDLIILDEGQRIKNWASKTSQFIRSLRSTFALVLSGTPLENRLDELFTVVQFVDDSRLGPAYKFFHQYRQVDNRGKPVGYKNLGKLRKALQPILLRRKRDQVAKQLPERTDEIIRIRPTEEQLSMSNENLVIAGRIAAKKFLTEMDLLRLQKALLLARMACDSTYLVDQQLPEYSSKLVRLGELLEVLIDDPTRKIVLFSEWKRMLDRIEIKLKTLDCDFVRLDGSVPQKLRPAIVSKFQHDANCRLILMTNAGSTGLNLQSANTVINVDLPWNPAVLEQRIARAHRMGQKNPVHVYKLVTEDTIEEKLLETLASKQDLADAALDAESDTDSVTMKSSITSIRERLEKILLPTRTAPRDESQKLHVESQMQLIQERRDRVSSASGQFIGAALQLVGELIKQPDQPEPDSAVVTQMTNSLNSCIQRDARGKPQLTISLENDEAVRSLAQTLARLLLPAASDTP